VSDEEDAFELVEFEQVEAAPGTALLRISARPSPTMVDGPLTLVVTDGPTEHRHEQLPALPGPPDLIRVAFSAPLEHVGQGANFALELADGRLVRLPAPTRRRAALSMQAGPGGAPARSTANGPVTEDEPTRMVEAERRAESRRLAIIELERRLQSERERRSAAESDIAFLRSERDEARSERDAALTDRDEALADRDQAEARARASASSAGTLEAQIRAATESAIRAQNALAAQVADRSAELDRMRTAAEVAQARAQASRRESTALDEKLAHAEAQVSVLQQSIDEREAEHIKAVAAMEDALAMARGDRTASLERIVALEEELEAARDAAARAQAQHAYDLETAQARLDVAHVEIEVARTETESLHHHSAELEATLAELDAALARRAAEIDLLRGVITQANDEIRRSTDTASVLSGPKLESLLADVRAEERADASAGLLAEVELLRTQVLEQGQELRDTQSSLDAAFSRVDAAEAALAAKARESEQYGDQLRTQVQDVQRSREQLAADADRTRTELEHERQRTAEAEAELERMRMAASDIAGELRHASTAVDNAKADAQMHERRAIELSTTLSSAERTLREARDAIAAHESKNRELAESVKTETEKRMRAEDALVSVTAQQALKDE
jgi:chromosome segregation ATPase